MFPCSLMELETTSWKRKEEASNSALATELGPLVSAILKASINLQNNYIIQTYGCEKVGLTRCLLTQEEMKTFHFPLQGSSDCENFIPTKCDCSITDSSPLFGLDSEMCLTSKGRELTRISLVAEGGHCIMDELVKPDFKILDYLTSFLGVMKILNPVTTKLRDVQKLLRELLPPDTVIHPYVIDTSLIYIGKQGRRFKLRFLTRVILGKNIHCPDKLGHDTREDARTTLELARYFLKYGTKKIAELSLEAIASHRELRAASQATGNQGAATKHPVPYFCIQYEVLEAAQLAIETMNGILVEGSYIRFKTHDSAQVALEILKGKDWKLKGRYALTPRHLQAWLKDIHPEPAMPSGLGIVPPLLEKHVFQTLKENHPKMVAWCCNRRIEKLYHSLSPGTLCLILLPGTKNTFGSHPGLGLRKIQEEDENDTPGLECESSHTFRVPLHIQRM